MSPSSLAPRSTLAMFAVVLAACATPNHPETPPPASVIAPSVARAPDAMRADEQFWRVFHGGAYDRIPDALRALQAAFLLHPHDAVTAAHIGWLHFWKLAEHARLD